MVDRILEDLFLRWENLSWTDKKRIAWISFWSQHKIDPAVVLSILAAISVLAVLMLETHHHHKPGLISTIVLVYFYGLWGIYRLS